MRKLPSFVMSGAMGVAIIGIWAPAAHAEGPLEVTRWDTSTCETEGAASPVITYTSGSNLPMSVVHAFGIDDQDGYASVRVGPGPGTVTETWAPVREGEHVVYEQNRDPGGPRGLELAITAPACAPEMPRPSGDVWPKKDWDVTATFGEPTCIESDGELVPELPFDFDNKTDDVAVIDFYLDGEPNGGGELGPVVASNAGLSMAEGEHIYSIVGPEGDELDSVTATAPDCADDPGTDEPGTDEPGTDEPTTDDGADAPTTGAPTPEIPKVVHTG